MMDQIAPEETKSNLTSLVGRVITVTVKDEREFRGKLLSFDEHMNLLLAEAEGPDNKKFELVLIKGGNISNITL